MRTKLANYLSAGKHAVDFYASFTIIPFFWERETLATVHYTLFWVFVKNDQYMYLPDLYTTIRPHMATRNETLESILVPIPAKLSGLY